ncbi:MAG: hypothetical protein IGR76_14440 [Synechococcales cyanobacterium T60_A2020_003]|nr:hypothetical protein [Synechococcales cyanobacterium T60_A2020_003]
MTPQATHIQTLIDEIDAVLSKTNTRLPWVMSGEAVQQRRVLEQTRQYLATLQSQATAERETTQQLSAVSSQVAEESAQQVLQAVLQEMGYLRSHIVQPIRADIERLHQEREALTAEIQQLQAQRQQALPPQSGQQQIIEDFMRSLMNRVQEQLTMQISQTVANLSASNAAVLPGGTLGALPQAGDLTALTPEQRVAQVQKIQAQSDQLLLKLDSTLRVIFESLQTSMQGYQESLGQGLEKMHSLGQQGEAMFAALVNRLAQQLGREASSYLQSSFQTGEWEPIATSQLPNSASQLSDTASFRALKTIDEVSDGPIDKILEELKADGISLDDEPSAIAASRESETVEPSETPVSAKSQPEPSPAAIAKDDEEPFPLEPIAEWEASDEWADSGWSPDADLDALDNAFDIMDGVSETDLASEPASDAAALEDDGFYESLFGAESEDELDTASSFSPLTESDASEPIELNGRPDDLDLFGGIVDPAESSEAAADDEPRRDETLSELSTQTLEGLLFPSTGALFEDGQFSKANAQSEIGDRANLDAYAEEGDAYTVAHPQEDLLSEDVQERPAADLTLDDGILDQLATDLQALERQDDSYTLEGFGEAIASPSEDSDSSSAQPEESTPPTPTGTETTSLQSVEALELEPLSSDPPPSLLGETDTQPTLGNFFGGEEESAATAAAPAVTPASRGAEDGLQGLESMEQHSPSSGDRSETDTQPTLDTFFSTDATDSASASSTEAVSPMRPPSRSTDPSVGNTSAGNILNLAADLNLIWESFEPVQPTPAPASVPETAGFDDDAGFTVDDAFGGLEDSNATDASEPSFVGSLSDAEESREGLTLGDFGSSVGEDNSSEVSASPQGNEANPSSTIEEGKLPPLSLSQSEPDAILGDFFNALDNAGTTSAPETVLEEQDVFSLDNVTLADLFEDLPDEQTTGSSKKN